MTINHITEIQCRIGNDDLPGESIIPAARRAQVTITERENCCCPVGTLAIISKGHDKLHGGSIGIRERCAVVVGDVVNGIPHAIFQNNFIRTVTETEIAVSIVNRDAAVGRVIGVSPKDYIHFRTHPKLSSSNGVAFTAIVSDAKPIQIERCKMLTVELYPFTICILYGSWVLHDFVDDQYILIRRQVGWIICPLGISPADIAMKSVTAQIVNSG